MKAALLALALALVALIYGAYADEMSGDDKLRMLYSHRFTFTKDALPLVTVEIMSGQSRVELSADGGLTALPDGDGGAEVVAGESWTVTAEGGRAATMRYWTIVAKNPGDTESARWEKRGYKTQNFDVGVVFGVKGDVLDSRATLLGVAPEEDAARAQKTATAIAEKWDIETWVHPELVKRPTGTVIATSSRGTVLRNRGVVWFAPTEGDTVTIADVVYGGGGAEATEKKETRRYAGRVYVTFGRDGKLAVVNAVPEDRLLAGLVPSEIYPDAPAEALKAQAVAARTSLLARIGNRHFGDPFLLCSSQHCQVYGGVALEDPRTTKAAEATRGEVLMTEDGRLVDAAYHSACGGHGEDNDVIWGTPPDAVLRGRLDNDDAKSTFARVTDDNVRDFLDQPATGSFCGRTRWSKGRSRWTVTLAAPDLDKLIAARHPKLGHITAIEPLQRGVSGRVLVLRVVGDKGSTTIEGELAIRRILGGLRSSLFAVRAKQEKGRTTAWIFDGAGAGHGVGMCQLGAIGMADEAHSYREILGHYYQGAKVNRLY